MAGGVRLHKSRLHSGGVMKRMQIYQLASWETLARQDTLVEKVYNEDHRSEERDIVKSVIEQTNKQEKASAPSGRVVVIADTDAMSVS